MEDVCNEVGSQNIRRATSYVQHPMEEGRGGRGWRQEGEEVAARSVSMLQVGDSILGVESSRTTCTEL